MKIRHIGYRSVVANWLVAYPLITVLLWVFNPVMASWPLPMQTLLLTVVVVPVMSLWALPVTARLQQWFKRHCKC